MAYITTNLCDEMTSEIVEAFNAVDIWTINDFCMINLMEIKRRTKIKFHVLKRIDESIKARYVCRSSDLAFELTKNMANLKLVPTGLSQLSLYLDGGFQTQELIEFFGESESGKTELCYQFCGLILGQYEKFHILFITPDHEFNHSKINHYTQLKYTQRRILTDDDFHTALKRIDVARPTNKLDLVHLLNSLVHQDKRNQVRVVVIDSLSILIEDDTTDLSLVDGITGDDVDVLTLQSVVKPSKDIDQARRISKDFYIYEIMRLLKNIAHLKNVIVIFTSFNSVYAQKSWINYVDHRIFLEKLPDPNYRRATVIKTIHSLYNIGKSVTFKIGKGGIETETNKPECGT